MRMSAGASASERSWWLKGSVWPIVLATLGVRDYNPLRRDRRVRLEALRTALGAPLPPRAHARITRMLDRLELVCMQIAELERERDAVLEEEAPDKAEEMIRNSPGSGGLACKAPPCWSGKRSCANSPTARHLVPTLDHPDAVQQRGHGARAGN
jgi:transposase